MIATPLVLVTIYTTWGCLGEPTHSIAFPKQLFTSGGPLAGWPSSSLQGTLAWPLGVGHLEGDTQRGSSPQPCVGWVRLHRQGLAFYTPFKFSIFLFRVAVAAHNQSQAYFSGHETHPSLCSSQNTL